MTDLTDEIERLRQRMSDEARETEVALVRLAADLEKLEIGLIEQLRSAIQAHEERKDLFLAELKTLSDSVRSYRTPQSAKLSNHSSSDLQWTARQGHLEYDDDRSEGFPN